MMFVLFFILFTNVLADSEEDKYVDLLPDEEKKQFIEQVARRILKDVERIDSSPKDSGELSDEQLKKHDEFVKSVLKEESENVRRSKEKPKDKGKNDSDEALDVKPLVNEKNTDDADVLNRDLTLRNERRDNSEVTTDLIKVEVITDEIPIIKRAVKHDNDSNDYTSEEISTNESIMEEEERLEYEKEKFKLLENTTVTPSENTTEKLQTVKSVTEVLTSTLKEVTTKSVDIKTKSSKEENPKTEILNNTKSYANKTESTDSNTEGTTVSSKIKDRNETLSTEKLNHETDGEDIQVKPINAPKSRRKDNSDESHDNTTEVNSAVEYFGPKSTESDSNENNNTANSDNEEFLTPSSISEPTTTSIPTTETKDESTEPIDELSTSIISTTDNTAKQESIESTAVTGTTLTDTMIDEGTTDPNTASTYELSSEKTTTSIGTVTYPTTSSPKYLTTEKPVTTTELKIAVEDFTSLPSSTLRINTLTTSEQLATIENEEFFNQEYDENTVEVSTETDEESAETTTLTPKTKKRKKKVKKTVKKESSNDKKNTVSTASNVDKNFIELEKVYYNNKKKDALKKEKVYRVFEIPPDQPPFVKNPEVPTLTVSEQPYYVPVYNYAPNNAYFNPQNRQGPNALDSDRRPSPFDVAEDANMINDEENLDPLNIDMDYSETSFDGQRKKFGNKPVSQPGIHKTPHASEPEAKPGKNSGKVNPDDYLDSYYYFGRLRNDYERRVYQMKDNYFPNSDEESHPLNSIQNMNLKDHVRAVRNILFQQKFFKTTSNDHDVFLEEEKKRENKRKRREDLEKYNDDDFDREEDDEETNNIAIDYYFGRSNVASEGNRNSDEDVQKEGYVNDSNNSKGFFLIDQGLKKNVLEKKHHKNGKDLNHLTNNVNLPIAAGSTVKKLDNKAHKMINLPKAAGSTVKKLDKKAQKMINLPKAAGSTVKKLDNKAHKMTNFSDEENVEKSEEIDAAHVANPEKNGYKMNYRRKHMQITNLTLQRRNDDVKIGVYLEVLKDMVYTDSKALKEYDWLGTTVDIQSSLQKLFELVALIKSEETMHPADIEILRYVVFIHKLAIEIVEANDFGSQLRKKLALPRNKKKKDKHRVLKEKGLINRVWLYLRKQVPEVNEEGALKNFNKFLMDVEDGLYDLHDAIKNIAKITKYKNQHWYQNLKELYLGTDEKHLLELLLHMSVSRLYGLIEESAMNGLENGYVRYMKTHRKESKRTLEEMLFVMQIVNEINKLEE